MSNLEFSNEFDILYNSITSNQSPGLDEYEKSVFLTKAQDEILKAYFLPFHNKSMAGFDGNEKRVIDFSTLIKSFDTRNFNTTTEDGDLCNHLNSQYVEFPDGILFVLNEYVEVERNGKDKRLTVVPIAYEEIDRVMSKPYTRPLKNQAWKIMRFEKMYTIDDDGTVEFTPENCKGIKSIAEIVVGYKDVIRRYYMRYVKRPTPIILTPFDYNEELSIGGYLGADNTGEPVKVGKEATKGLECTLPAELHPEILQRAVELAKAAYTGDLSSQVTLGQVSQTDIGQVQTSK